MLPRPSTSPKSPNNPSNQVPSCNGILAKFWSLVYEVLRAILITIFITIVIQILIANFSAFLDQKFETFEKKFQNSNSKLEAKSSSFLEKIFGTFEKKFQNDTSQIQNSISKLDEKLKNISQSQMENGKFAIL